MSKIKAAQKHVTVATLRAKGACGPDISRFVKTFPKGSVRITRKNLQKVARWLSFWWLECHYLGLMGYTSRRLNDKAFLLAKGRGVEIRTPIAHLYTIGYKRIRADVLADYLGLP